MVECLVCFMVHHVAQSATHKFAFTPPEGEALLVFLFMTWLMQVWVFSVDTAITTSSILSARRVVKILYQDAKVSSDDVEIVKLDGNVVGEIRRVLRASSELMVEGGVMGNWSVGYLERV